MRIISGITVEEFRSIRSADVAEFGDLTTIAGLNNSGKSNLLRALNAFFTGEVEPGIPLALDRDYYRPDMSKKKARRIRISVRFSLPATFSFRKDLEPVKDILGTEFDLAKEWWLRHEGVAYHLNGHALDLVEQRKVEQFLRLINFRYVPNRVLPLDVIRSEHRALRDALVRRVAKKAKGSEEAFDALRETSTSLIRAMVERIQALQPDAGSIRLATPTSWSDMVFAFGYMLEQDGSELEDVLQGSGLQSVLMLETLYLIDQDYFQKFGWRQAAIWGIEEPESSLHTSLEAQVASFLQSIASAPRSRLQVVCTTHSDLMIQYADRPLFAQRKETGTTFEAAGKRVVLERAAKAGVSRWVHPILYFPLDPLVLVEGRHDRTFLDEAFRVLRPSRSIRIADLEELGDGGSGGIDRLLGYVKENAGVIKARARTPPSSSYLIGMLPARHRPSRNCSPQQTLSAFSRGKRLKRIHRSVRHSAVSNGSFRIV
jgi:predicted ATP-dependent endonuclease of OLD family